MARDRNVKKWLSKLIISHCGLRFSAYDYLFKMHPESGKERERQNENEPSSHHTTHKITKTGFLRQSLSSSGTSTTKT